MKLQRFATHNPVVPLVQMGTAAGGTVLTQKKGVLHGGWEEEEEEEEAVFISVVNTNEDPPNAHQAQHRPVQDTGAMSA